MTKSVLFFSLLLFPLFAIAQKIDFSQPPNSSFLAEYGISPKVFNILATPLYQEEAIMHAHLDIKESYKGKLAEANYKLIYNPFYEYGLTLNLVVNREGGYDYISKSKLKKLVGKTHEKYKKIRDKDLIGEDEVGLVKAGNEEVILGFKIKKSNLPNNLKYLGEMNGLVFINNGILDSITLDLASPMKVKQVLAKSLRIVTKFKRLETGGYFVESVEEQLEGSKQDSPYKKTEILKVSGYYNPNGELIDEFAPQEQIAKDDSENDTLKVKLERALPLLGNAARKAGYELPQPYGVDLFTHFQRETLGLEKIVLNGDDLTKSILAPGGSSAKALTNIVAARGDVWILPFFNVTIMSGHIYGSTEVTLKLSDEVKEALDLIDIQADQIVVNTEITGPMIGAGFTAAGGYKNFFATVNGMYVNQIVKEAGTSVDAYAITPLVGLRLPKIINVVVGGQYQIYNSNVSGSIELEGENLNYDVELKATKWNWLFGLQRDFSNSWNGTIMVGGQPRPQATVVLGYRF